MAGAASWNTFTLNAPPAAAVAAGPPHVRRSSLALTALRLRSPISRSRGRFLSSPAPIRTRAVVDDDEWGKEGGGEPESGVAVVEPPVEVLSEAGELKRKLMDLLSGTDRGLKASSETRAEIVELITQLEAKNPTPAPTDALPLLNGKWILA